MTPLSITRGIATTVAAILALLTPAIAANEFGTLYVRYVPDGNSWDAVIAYKSPGPPAHVTVTGTLAGNPVNLDAHVTGERTLGRVPVGRVPTLDDVSDDLTADLRVRGNSYTLALNTHGREALADATLIAWTRLSFRDGRTLTQDVTVTEGGKTLRPRTFTVGDATLESYDLTGFASVDGTRTVTWTETCTRRPGKVHVFWYVPLKTDPVETHLEAEVTVQVPFTVDGNEVVFQAPEGAPYTVRYVGPDGLHEIEGTSRGGTVRVEVPEGSPASVTVTGAPTVVTALERKDTLGRVTTPTHGLRVTWSATDTGATVLLEGESRGAILGIVADGSITKVVGGEVLEEGKLPTSGLPYAIVRTNPTDGTTTVNVYSTGPVLDVLATTA